MYFSLIVLTVILGIVLGLSSFVMLQIRMVRGMGNSVVAFHAANSGIERGLDIIKRRGIISHSETSTIILTPEENVTYQLTIDPPGARCNRLHYCIRSNGIYRETTRAIEVGG